jgi:geranylgeranylglycerol-phosphate geranylgeranyltransferase
MKRNILQLGASLLPALLITRPWNCLSALLAVLVGAHIAGMSMFKVSLLLAALTAAVITGGGNVTNDYFDREIDAINKPNRPLPSHRLTPSAAVLLALALYIIGIGISLPLGVSMAVIAVAMVILAFLYSWKIKNSFLIGNVLVAFLSSMTVVYGGLVVRNVGKTLPSMLLIFVFILCREVLKTAEDYTGDSAHRLQTVAVVLGRSTAARLFAGGAILIVGLAFWPGLIGQVSFLYFILILFVIAPTLLVAAVMLWLRPDQRQISLVLRATKLIFFVWLVAMLVR